MNIRIVFICHDCEQKNKSQLGLPGFEVVETQFDNLTDAYFHIRDTDSSMTGYAHTVDAVIKEDK